MARAKDTANAGMNALLGPSVPGLIPGGGGCGMGIVTEARCAGGVLALVGGFHHRE